MSPKPRVFASMGVEVVVDGATAGELDAIRRLFAGWDAVFSRFRPDSELSRINRDPAKVVVLSRLFAYVTRAALGAAAATEGLVDPTLGLGIEAAGYDRDFSEVGDDGPLGESAPGRWRELRLSGRLLSRPPGVALDLNGVAKALAVDAALEELSGKGFVSAGGDVATRGGAVVGLPGGGSLRLVSGGLATSDDEAPVAPGRRDAAPPARPAHGPPFELALGAGHGRCRITTRGTWPARAGCSASSCSRLPSCSACCSRTRRA
jgi:ApbE family